MLPSELREGNETALQSRRQSGQTTTPQDGNVKAPQCAKSSAQSKPHYCRSAGAARLSNPRARRGAGAAGGGIHVALQPYVSHMWIERSKSLTGLAGPRANVPEKKNILAAMAESLEQVGGLIASFVVLCRERPSHHRSIKAQRPASRSMWRRPASISVRTRSLNWGWSSSTILPTAASRASGTSSPL